MVIANVEMAAIWDGEEGDEWTENADRYDATGRFLERRFEAEVVISPTARVLDVGCGTGKSTRDAARQASAGHALGIDLSARMLEHARRQSAEEGITNVEYVQGDAQVHPFDAGAFDLAISAFGAMFFADPVAAFANIRPALRSGGEIAFLSWQPFDANEWCKTIFGALAAGRTLSTPTSGSPGPFGLADDDAVIGILRQAGYVDPELISIVEPMWFGSDGDDAWAFVSSMGIVGGLTNGLEDPDRQRALDQLRQAIEVNATEQGVLLGSAAWLITARTP